MRYKRIHTFALKMPLMGLEPATLTPAAQTVTKPRKCARGKTPQSYAIKTRPTVRISPIFRFPKFHEWEMGHGEWEWGRCKRRKMRKMRKMESEVKNDYHFHIFNFPSFQFSVFAFSSSFSQL